MFETNSEYRRDLSMYAQSYALQLRLKKDSVIENNL